MFEVNGKFLHPKNIYNLISSLEGQFLGTKQRMETTFQTLMGLDDLNRYPSL